MEVITFWQARLHSSVVVPVHGNSPLKSGLLHHLLKIAEIELDSLK
jgi:predicted RNA binding protein YcfA (HicA-like mRNA interferase family)